MKNKKAPKSPAQSLILTAFLAAASLSAYATDSGSLGWLLICNKGDHALGIIDPVAGKQIATIPEDGVTGHEVIASADGIVAICLPATGSIIPRA